MTKSETAREVRTISVDISTDAHIKLGEQILVSIVEQYACSAWANVEAADDTEHGYSAVYLREPEGKHGYITAQQIIASAKMALLYPSMQNTHVITACARALFQPEHCDYDLTVADVLAQFALLEDLVYG